MMASQAAPKLSRVRYWTFSGCGWLFMYHLGVCKALQNSGAFPLMNVTTTRNTTTAPSIVAPSASQLNASSATVAAVHSHLQPSSSSSSSSYPKAIGASGGALAAFVLVSDVDMDLVVHTLRSARDECHHSYAVVFQLRRLIEQTILRLGPTLVVVTTPPAAAAPPACSSFSCSAVSDGGAGNPIPPDPLANNHPLRPDVAERLAAQIEVYITQIWPWRSLVYNPPYRDLQDCTEALTTSACIPPFAGCFAIKQRRSQRWAFDGGFTAALPRYFEGRGWRWWRPVPDNICTVVSVCPFNCFPRALRARVSPAFGRGFPMHWAFLPPKGPYFESLFIRGYLDGLAYLQERGALATTVRPPPSPLVKSDREEVRCMMSKLGLTDADVFAPLPRRCFWPRFACFGLTSFFFFSQRYRSPPSLQQQQRRIF